MPELGIVKSAGPVQIQVFAAVLVGFVGIGH